MEWVLQSQTGRVFKIEVALSLRRRFLGLMGRKKKQDNALLLLPNCRLIHTLGMRFPLDIYAFSSCMRVVKREEKLSTARVFYSWQARYILEVPSHLALEEREFRELHYFLIHQLYGSKKVLNQMK